MTLWLPKYKSQSKIAKIWATARRIWYPPTQFGQFSNVPPSTVLRMRPIISRGTSSSSSTTMRTIKLVGQHLTSVHHQDLLPMCIGDPPKPGYKTIPAGSETTESWSGRDCRTALLAGAFEWQIWCRYIERLLSALGGAEGKAAGGLK